MKKVVFVAYSKRYFYCKDTLSTFVFFNGAIPINPFKQFDYFMHDVVPRDWVREANNTLILKSDELWVFGEEVADGVLKEMCLATLNKIPIKLYSVSDKLEEIHPIEGKDLRLEQYAPPKAKDSSKARVGPVFDPIIWTDKIW